jgi:ubiquinone biosynthesis protein
VPTSRSIDAFTQACRSIGEPILGRPLQEISVARLLAQLFEITEQFDMETQPQLLLLQKTMVVIEGVGRRLDPEINIWALAQPLIEEWMRDNRGPEARVWLGLETIADLVERVPRLVRSLDALIAVWSRDGIVMHAETLAIQAAHRARHLAFVIVPVWIIALALAGIAVALLFGR